MHQQCALDARNDLSEKLQAREQNERRQSKQALQVILSGLCTTRVAHYPVTTPQTITDIDAGPRNQKSIQVCIYGR